MCGSLRRMPSRSANARLRPDAAMADQQTEGASLNDDTRFSVSSVDFLEMIQQEYYHLLKNLRDDIALAI